MKKVYAITGGIGSGKSVVSKIIKSLGYTVLSADEVYANLLKTGDFSREIYNVLGLNYNAEKGFDRKEVSAVVFNNVTKLNALNNFTHAKVMEELNRLTKSESGIVFHEVPLLLENGFESKYNGVIVVYRNLKDRINAVILRDGLTEEEVIKRIKNQYDYEKNDISAHTVIVNDGVLNNLTQKVKAVINNIESQN